MKSALIGAGVIGKVHAKNMALLGMPFDAICDINEEKAVSLAELTSPEAKIYTDLKQMINEIEPDVVHICTPHYLHAEQVIYALDKNVNVLCEKPLCAHPEQLAGILEAEKRSSAVLGVCQQNRYNETVAFAKDYLKDKRIISGHASVCWCRTEEYYKEGPWRGKLSEAGGGALINQALHTLDLLEEFCGVPHSLTARADILMPKTDVEVEDTVNAVFFGKYGMRYTFFASINNLKNIPVEISIVLENKDVVTILPKTVLVNGKTVFESENRSQGMGKACYGNGHAILFADYYDCLKTGRKFPIDGKEAAKVLRLIFGVYASKGENIILP